MSPLIQYVPVVDRHRLPLATRLQIAATEWSDALALLPLITEHWHSHLPIWISTPGAPLKSELTKASLPSGFWLELESGMLDEHKELLKELHRQQVSLCLNTPRRPLSTSGFSHVLCTEPSEKCVASSLESQVDFEFALDEGIVGASGWFFLNAPKRAQHEVSSAYAQVIQVLNLVRNEAEIGEVEAALKHDVSLAFKLLRYINSAGFGLQREIGSFRQAVTIVGYNKLNRWLSLLLVNASEAPFARALMQTAVVRGRYMEQLADACGMAAERDNLFICGAFSLLDILLGTSLEALMGQLKLPDGIRDALLTQSGPLYPMLQLTRMLETGSPEAIRTQLETLGIPVEYSNTALVSALAFADQVDFE